MTAGPVLVGFDGSAESRDALALGRSLAGAIGTRVIAGAVLDYFPQDPATAAVDSFEAAVAEDRDRLAATLEKLDADLELDTVIALSAAHGLETLADERAAEIVVVGSTHRGAAGRIALGSMAERLVSGSEKAVAVAPRGYADPEGWRGKVSDVGVAYDGSPESEAALGFAAGLTAASGGRLKLICAIEPWSVRAPALPGAPIPVVETTEQFEARQRSIEERLERALETLSPRVDARGVTEVGPPADVLVSESAQLYLLVLGSRGYGPVRRVLLGSVSSKVARAARCPVLVVPRTGSDGEARHRVMRATGEAAVGLVPLRG